jgi:hypothetical protein
MSEQGAALVPMSADGTAGYTGSAYYSLKLIVTQDGEAGTWSGECAGGGTVSVGARSTGSKLTVEFNGNDIACHGSLTTPHGGTVPLYQLPLSPHQLGPAVLDERDGATAQVVRDVESPPFSQHRVSQFRLAGYTDWCEEAKKMHLEETATGHSAAGVICVRGQAHTCVWQRSRLPEIDECALEHERSHLAEVECPRISSFETSLFPTRPSAQHTQASEVNECKAYQRQLRCLQEKQAVCSKPGVLTAACQREFDFFTGAVKAQTAALRCH